jgi:tetratricopeptide (TPR) repeat protein
VKTSDAGSLVNTLNKNLDPDVDAVDSATPLEALRRARDTLMGIADFNAALNPAKQIIDLQETSHDPGYAEDVQALARINLELGKYDESEAEYLQSIDLIEAQEGEFSLTLVGPYRGLGRVYIKSARYPEAITALKEAQHISQRNLGLFNVEQAPLLDDITTAYLGAGDTVEARKLQIERVDNAVKRFGADDPRVVPFRYELADYYERSRLPLSAREQYAEVLKSRETAVGPDDPELLQPLRDLVKVDLTINQGKDRDAYMRLVALLERHPEADRVQRGLTLAVLGDWATVTEKAADAEDYYRRAWETLSSSPGFDVAQYFANPVALDFVTPLSAVDRGERSKPYGWISAAVRFDLTAQGRPLNVEAVGVDRPIPSNTLLSRYLRRVRETHFRPRLVDGQAAATRGVEFTHYFRVYVDDKKREKEKD